MLHGVATVGGKPPSPGLCAVTNTVLLAKGVVMIRRHWQLLGTVFVCVSALALWGCSDRQVRIHPPAIDASAAGSGAIEQYDADGDGMIGGAELEKAGSIKSALKTLDTNGDGKVSAEEVTTRVQAWEDSKIGRMSLSCTVTRGGMPLSDATVTFVPEKFLGEEVKAATGTTDKYGRAVLTAPEAKPPGVACGLYRVEISKEVGGGETIPAIYNTETILGQEVAMGAAGMEAGVFFNLTR